MDQTTRASTIKTLRLVANRLLAETADAPAKQSHPFAHGQKSKADPVLELKKSTQAMENSMKKFKAKPTDDAYFDVLTAMKAFRQWVYKVHYENTPQSASATREFDRAVRVWRVTADHKPLLNLVLSQAQAARASR